MQFTAFRLEFRKIQKYASEYKSFRLFHFDDLAFFWRAINMPIFDLDSESGALSNAIYSFSIRVQQDI